MNNPMDSTNPRKNSVKPVKPVKPVTLPAKGVLLGLDFGTKRMGVAVSNSDQTVAVPVETWLVREPAQNLKHLRELIEDYRAVGVVLGLPIRTNGEEGTAAAVVRQFGVWVAEKTKLPLVYVDERYSSAAAELLIWRRGESPSKRKQPLDSLAAIVILQSYLEAPDRIIPLPVVAANLPARDAKQGG
jgi:putative Holliday junction resolvase